MRSGKQSGDRDELRLLHERVGELERENVQLRTSEDRLQILFEHAPDAYYLSDLKGTFVDGNTAAERVTGYKRGELIGKSFLTLKLLAPGDLLRASSLLAKNLLGHPTGPDEFTLTRKDGTPALVEIHTHPVRIGDRRLALGIARDISARKQTERQLRERVKELRALYSLAEIIGRDGITLGEVYQELTNALPESWQYPEITCARIRVGDSEFRTGNFADSPQKQSAPVRVAGVAVGSIDVGYLDERPEADEGPFLKEERRLIDALAERLGRVIERKNAEEGVRESEKRLSLVLGAAKEGIYDVDLRTGLTFTSPEYAAMLGYDPTEILLSPESGVWESLLHPDDRESAVRTVNGCRAGETDSFDMELRLRTKAGDWRWVRSCGQVVERDLQGNALRLVGTHTDIDSRKRADEILRVKDWAIESAINGMAISDLAGSLSYVNPAFVRLWGYGSPAEILGRSVVEFWQMGDKAEEVAETVRSKGGWRGDLVAQRKDGVLFDVHVSSNLVLDAAGRPICMQAAFEDITVRKRADEALRESEDRYRSLVDNVPEIIFTIDLQGKLTFVSRQAKEILGYESAEAINMSVLAFIPEEEHQRVTEGIRRGMAGEKLQHLQVPMTKKSGERVLFECSFTRVYQAGRVIGAQGTAVDITERKRAEDARALNSQRVQALLQLNQMAAATLQEITDFALEEAVRLTQSKIGYLAFLNEDESVLTMHSWSKSAMAECAIAEKPIVYPVLSTGLWGEAVRQRRPVITNDYAAADPRKKGYPQGHVALTRHMNTPVFDGSRIVIVAGVGNKTEEYDQSDIQQLTLLMEGMWRLIERKHAQEALRDSEARYRTLFEHSADGILIADLGTKVFKYANPAVCRMLGYTAEEMRTIGVADIHPKDALPHVVTEFEAQTRGEKELATDLPCLTKDGTLLYADVNATAAAIDGRPCLVGFFRDSTVRRRTQEALMRSLEATLSVLSHTAEMRDPYTAGHQRRVTELAIALARKLGFPDDECGTLRIAGLLHDIGKLGIPAEILSKPSVLSPIEFEFLRTHPQAAYEILADATFPDLVAKIVLQHHERLDGSGYPKKISGADILPEARILAVADVVEAMASHRPYRPALGIEAALAEIRAGRGTRYDQQVADACVALFESGEFSFQPASAG